MPASKQGGGYTLSFSKKNQDVKEILKQKKDKGIIVSDFICEAIRFFNDNEGKINNTSIDIKEIEKLIDMKFEEKFEEKLKTLYKSDKEYNLESCQGIDAIDIEED